MTLEVVKTILVIVTLVLVDLWFLGVNLHVT
jgi:hypothetical protein